MTASRLVRPRALAGLVVADPLTVCLALTLLWSEPEQRHHWALDTAAKVTTNADGISGDLINTSPVGSRPERVGAMLAAGWRPADPITLRTSLDIAESVLFDRPDSAAPACSLYRLGRKHDLAVEREVGCRAARRHHVRWWTTDQPDAQGRPLWLGAASFAIGPGISHLTGQITRHITPDIDAERDALGSSRAKTSGRGRRDPGRARRRWGSLRDRRDDDLRDAGGDGCRQLQTSTRTEAPQAGR